MNIQHGIPYGISIFIPLSLHGMLSTIFTVVCLAAMCWAVKHWWTEDEQGGVAFIALLIFLFFWGVFILALWVR